MKGIEYLNPTLPEATVMAAIADQYGLEISNAVEHRKVWRLQTPCGVKYMKKSKLSPAELRFIHEALEHLHRCGFNQAVRYLLNRNGEPFLQTGSSLYVLTDWYEGHELNFQILMDLKQAASLLARFHLASRGFEPENPPTGRTGWSDWLTQWEQRIRQLREFRALACGDRESTFSRLFLRYFELFYRQANASCQSLCHSPYNQVAQAASCQCGFCHHDYSSRNLLRTWNCQLMMIDFDYCLRDIRIHDLVNLLVRNLKHLDWQTEISRFILTEYHRVSPLEPEELRVMHVILSWPQDFWQLGLQYYHEKLPWPPERFVKKLESRIAMRFHRERFLKQFPEQNGVHCWREW